MNADLDELLADTLGDGRPIGEDEAFESSSDPSLWSATIEDQFAEAGFYSGDEEPYESPETPSGAPRLENPPIVDAVRRVWISRYNPTWSDVADTSQYPWNAPELAPRDGWWLSTINTSGGRPAISEITTDDLVLMQRTDPGPAHRDASDMFRTTMLFGLAGVARKLSWLDVDTGEREIAVCLMPLCAFDDPVPRKTAKVRNRLKGLSFSAPRQLPGRGGPVGMGLSFVEAGDTVELLSVCGIDPVVLAEPNLATIASRLRASRTGSKKFADLRYDHVIRHEERRRHERRAEEHAVEWAERNGYVLEERCQHVPGAGFDMLFMDSASKQLQMEVKGYSTSRLRNIHLQDSQKARARAAASGLPPEWVLYALLQVSSDEPTEHIVTSQNAVQILDDGGFR